jgi:polyisoprenoid-binding protein YceI
MKRATIVALLILGTLHAASAQTTETRDLDPVKSKAQFAIQHIFVDRVSGTIPIVSGSIDLAEGSLIPVKATAVLDPGKMNTGDRDRDGSLESPNYFDTKTFPAWTFTSTKIVPDGAAAFGMDGMLTIHGVTAPEHLDVVIRGDATHPVYHATGRIDRRTWNMKGTRLDPVIGTEAEITLDVMLK